MNRRNLGNGNMANSAEHHNMNHASGTQAQAQHTSLDHQSFEPTGSSDPIHTIPKILPHERVFPIQIGSELFKLSGASISSDAPSYFSQYFQCQLKQAEEQGIDIASAIRTLYIDRDPATFRDISLHLQGYHVQPRDSTHFVRLFADAQFYNLPKLISQLHEESIYTTVGNREFQIPRELFTADPGNSPNFFSLGFAAFFSNPDDLFPGLDREGLLRPPSIIPPSVPGRSADIFAELLNLLRGYPVKVRSEEHRAELLRDCRYFHFKGLEQRLIPHEVSFNLARGRREIVLRLRDILKSGISVVGDPTAVDPLAAWVSYARPFVDEKACELVLEVGEEGARLQFATGDGAAAAGGVVNARVEFFGETRVRVAKLLEVVATKLNLPPTTQPLGLLMAKGGAGSQQATPGNTPLSEDLVKAVLGPEASVKLDGKPWAGLGTGEEEDQYEIGGDDGGEYGLLSRKRRRVEGTGGMEQWIVKTGQWRLKIQGVKNGKAAVECCLVAVKLDAFSSEQARNVQRSFLSG